MKLLVTGGCGFIGSALVRRLLASNDFSVVNVDKLTYAATPEAIGAAPERRYVLERHDICDGQTMESIIAAHQPDAIIHAAAESHVDRSIGAPAEFIQTNVLGTYTLLEAARAYWEQLPDSRRESFRFIHVSTDEVFGDLTPEAAPFEETTAYNPNSPYSASKASSDHLARAWHRTFGLPTVVTNCSNNYGPWQAPEKLIPVVITRLAAAKPIPVYGDGMNVRDWIHVEDHVDALLAILAGARGGERYNVGGQCEIANLDLVKLICRIMDKLVPEGSPHERHIGFVTDRKGHDRRYAVNCDRLRRELGWSPTRVIDDGLGGTVAWYLDNRDWCQRALARIV